MIAMTSSDRNCVRICSCAGANRSGAAAMTQAPASRARRPMTINHEPEAFTLIEASITREQALRPDDENDEEQDMAGENLPGGVELRADRLGDAERDAADQRAPKAAEAAEHHRFEGDEQTARPAARVEI